MDWEHMEITEADLEALLNRFLEVSALRLEDHGASFPEERRIAGFKADL